MFEIIAKLMDFLFYRQLNGFKMAFESDLQGNSKEISTKEKCAGTKINESIYEEVRKLLDSAVSMAFFTARL